MYKRVKSILEAAALDPERLVAPKDIWFDNAELERWFESRREIQPRGVDVS
jgi:hypothetical protein